MGLGWRRRRHFLDSSSSTGQAKKSLRELLESVPAETLSPQKREPGAAPAAAETYARPLWPAPRPSERHRPLWRVTPPALAPNPARSLPAPAYSGLICAQPRSPNRRRRKTEKEEDAELIQNDTEEETVFSFQTTPTCALRATLCARARACHVAGR